MGIDVEAADDPTAERWDEQVARAPLGSIFHTGPVLEVLAEQSGGECTRLVGYKGQEVIGHLPVFELSKGPVSTVFSPPPRLGVPAMGPVPINCGKLKQRKRERANKRFVEGCLDWLAEEIDPKFTHVETVPGYRDVRPFQWNEFETTPRYTYEVDLTGGPDAVMDRFKKSLRSDIRRVDDDEYEVFEGGGDAIEFVIEQVRARFEAQGKTYGIEPEYVIDLARALPDDALRTYVGAVDGEWLVGIIVLQYGSQAYYWQGGGKPDAPIPINDLIQWALIRDLIDRGVGTYDLTGANTHRIARYKSKFNPELVPYYELERGTRTMNVVSDVYRRLR